jgi:uncharacterized protein YqjF (DUF2071 family)
MSGREPDHDIRRPVSAQTWADLTFLHWRLPASTVQALLPRGLEVQTIDGSAWVGLVPFRMRDVRVPGLPTVPGWSDFPELNVRTYVRGPDGHDGVWFFHLFCTPWTFVGALRTLGLPYRHSGARVVGRGRTHSYRFTQRSDPPGRPLFAAVVGVGGDLDDRDRTPLVDSLTGRWNAYAVRFGRLLRVPVEHEPWPLRTAALGRHDWRWAAFGMPEPAGDPLVHFSPGVHARFGAPVLLAR